MIKKLFVLFIIFGCVKSISFGQGYFDKYISLPDSVTPSSASAKLIATKDHAFLYFTIRSTTTYHELLLIKFDNAGNELWTSKITSVNQSYFFGIAELPDSSFAVSGFISNLPGTFGNVLMRISKNGQLLYVKNIRSSDGLAGYGYDIVTLTDTTLSIMCRHNPFSNLYRQGNIISDFNGNHISNSFFTINNRTVATGKYQKITGGFIQSLQMYDDTLPSNPGVIGLLKGANDGTILWAKQITSPALFKYTVYNMTELPSKNIILCGDARPYGPNFPPERGFIACIDSSGSVLWLKHYAPVHTYWTSVIPYGSSSFIVTGSLADTIIKQKGIVAKINENGTMESYAYFRPDSCRVNSGKTASGTNSSIYTVFNADSVYTPINNLMFEKYDDQFLLCNKINFPLTDTTISAVNIMQWSDTLLTFVTTDITSMFIQVYDTLGFADRCLTTNVETFSNTLGFINIFPNPAPDKITISFPATAEQTITTKIYSITGEVVFAEENKTGNNYFNKTINVTGLSNGIYFLSVQTGWEVITKKIVVQH